ncbi:hypothetical protein M0805_000519 [Coniferiporia weirii]|nr:hypothetical protein M0805_000519 [Coniferiporia weirii]
MSAPSASSRPAYRPIAPAGGNHLATRDCQRDEKPFECDVCGHKFKRAHCLGRHLVTHDPDKEKLKHKCPYFEMCGYSALQKSNVTVHLNSYHYDLKRVCTIPGPEGKPCAHLFSDQSALIRHEKHVHKFFRKAAKAANTPEVREKELEKEVKKARGEWKKLVLATPSEGPSTQTHARGVSYESTMMDVDMDPPVEERVTLSQLESAYRYETTAESDVESMDESDEADSPVNALLDESEPVPLSPSDLWFLNDMDKTGAITAAVERGFGIAKAHWGGIVRGIALLD